MSLGSPEQAQLEDRARLLAESVQRVAGELGYSDAEAELRAVVGRFTEVASSLVVVGEANRGKTSLVNAILGREGLLPVDFRVATNVPIAVRYGPSERVRVLLDDGTEPSATPLDQLPRWATVRGERERIQNEPEDASVAAIEVFLDDPLLARGLVLIDTPGVGGLDAAHARVTLETLPQADALLFVLDATAPVSEQELTFLEQARAKVGTVIFALTKVDEVAASDRERILEEDRRLIGARIALGNAFRIFPVSSMSHTHAAQLRRGGDAAGADVLDAESGFGPLIDQISLEVIERGHYLRLHHIVDLAGGILERCRSGVESRRLATGSDDISLAARERQLSAATAALEPDAAWSTALAQAVGDLKERLVGEERKRREWRILRPFQQRIETGDVGDIAAISRELSREVAAIYSALGVIFATELTRLTTKLHDVLEGDRLEDLVADITPTAPEAGALDVLPAGRSSPMHEFNEDAPAAVASAATAAAGIYRAVAAAAAAAPAAAPLAAGTAPAGGALATTAAPAAAVGAGGALTTGGAAAVPATGVSATGAVGGTAGVAAGGVTVATGAALVLGAVVIGSYVYRANKRGKLKEARQALDAAIAGTQQVLDDYLRLADSLQTDVETLVSSRAKARTQELADVEARDSAERKQQANAADKTLALIDRLQAERSDIRAGLASVE